MPESMEKFEGEFLKKKYWPEKEFREVVEKSAEEIPSAKPAEKIPLYLERIEQILEKKRGLFERISLYQRYVIKPEDIPEEHFKNVRLGNFAEQKGYTREQLKDPQLRERVIQQFQKETNQDFATYQIPKEERESLSNQIIEDQKKSLDYWLDYLTSPEAKEHYPRAFRYWAFGEMLKLGSYNPQEKVFFKRDEKTVAPFPELNQQALSLVLDEILKKHTKKESTLVLPPEQKKEFQKRLEGESFNKLYGWALDYVKSLVTPKEQLAITKGEWILFPKGSNPEELTKRIGGFSTGWCIAASATAESYLRDSNILIYFSQDKEGKNTIPRAAIVTDGREISEVRGIGNDQNLDTYITPVVDSKVKELPGGERWQKQTEDMKKLTNIYLKHLQGEELTSQELRFLYEIDEKIKGFGYQRDSRIEEILKTRNIRKDLAQIMECDETQISLTKKEALKGNIKFHYGDLDLKSLTSAKGLELPKRIGGDLNLGSLTSAKGLKFPEEIGGNLYLRSLTSAEDLKLPKRIGGGLDLKSLTSAKGLELPKRIGGGLYLGSLTSAEGLKFPEEIGGYLNLDSLTSAKDLKLPERIGGGLYLGSLTSAEGLKLPEKIGGDLDLGSLTSAKGLELPKAVVGYVYLTRLPPTEKEKLKEKYPQLKIS